MKIQNLLPPSLVNEYFDDPTVAAVFQYGIMKEWSREETLVNCIKALIKINEKAMEDVKTLNAVRGMLSVTHNTDYIPKLSVLKAILGIGDDKDI